MMQWEMSDEEKLLRQSAVEFFQEKLPVNSLRHMRDHNDQIGFAPEIWQEMAQLGWTAILIPEEFGGLNFGMRGMGLVLEAAGRTLAATPLLSASVCAGTVVNASASAQQKQSLLPAIAEGRLRLAVAHEEGAHAQRQKIATRASRQGEGFVLTGRKTMVLDGQSADKILVLARSRDDEEALSWFMIDRQAPGVMLKTFRLVDGRLGCHLNLDSVELAPESLLGYEGRAAESYEEMLDAAAVGLAAEVLGSTTVAFEMTLAYLKERKQFGVAIGSFQALQHRAAQMYCELEVCRAVVQRALAAFDARDQDRSMYASLAKAKVSEVFQHVAREAVQLHGGIGMTDEHAIGFYLKRSRITAELFGNANFHRERYGRFL